MGFPLAVPDSVNNACAVVKTDWKAIRKHMAKDTFLTDKERELLEIYIKACQAVSLLDAAGRVFDSSEMKESALKDRDGPYGLDVTSLESHLDEAAFQFRVELKERAQKLLSVNLSYAMQAYSSIFLDRLLIFHPPLNDDSIATKESSSKDSASLAITDHGSASPKAVDRKSTSPAPSNDTSSSDAESSRAPSREQALKLLEEEMKDDCRLRDCAREQLSGLVDLYKAFFLIKAAGDTFNDSSSDVDQGSVDQVHHHLGEATWYIEVAMKEAAREFLGSQDMDHEMKPYSQFVFDRLFVGNNK